MAEPPIPVMEPDFNSDKWVLLTLLAREGFNCIRQSLRQGDTTTALELSEAFKMLPDQGDHRALNLLIERLGIICYSNYHVARILNPYILALAK